jgi:hypothetical protein
MISMKEGLFVSIQRLYSVIYTKYLDVLFARKWWSDRSKKKKRLSWCLERRRWTVNLHWNQVIFSYESQIVIGQHNRVYVWRFSNEVYRPECMCPPYQRKVSVMIRGYITWYGVGTLCDLQQVDGFLQLYTGFLQQQNLPARYFIVLGFFL